MVYLIKPRRLIKELSTHAKGKGKGILNWFVNSEDNNNIYIYYDYANVTYCCISQINELPIELKYYLGSDFEILGLMKEKEDLIEHPYLGDDDE